jgi:hypothetical protein
MTIKDLFDFVVTDYSSILENVSKDNKSNLTQEQVLDCYFDIVYIANPDALGNCQKTSGLCAKQSN